MRAYWRVGMVTVAAIATTSGCGGGDETGPLGGGEVQAPQVTAAPRVTAYGARAVPTTGPPQISWSVAGVIDGDTLDVSGPNGVSRVRLIGVDAPEIGACFAEQAANALRFFAQTGTPVTLVTDVSETDQYNRLLRYVEVTAPDGTTIDIGGALVEQGFAVASAYSPDAGRRENYAARQAVAQATGAGQWAPGACPAAASENDTPPAPEVAPPIQPAVDLSGACDPSYPNVCIPPGPPDLSCSDITPRQFTVVAPDPHGFDGDGDGIGCEG